MPPQNHPPHRVPVRVKATDSSQILQNTPRRPLHPLHIISHLFLLRVSVPPWCKGLSRGRPKRATPASSQQLITRRHLARSHRSQRLRVVHVVLNRIHQIRLLDRLRIARRRVISLQPPLSPPFLDPERRI